MAGRPPGEMKCWVVVPSSVVAVDALARSARIGVWLLGPVGPEIVASSTNPSFSCARSLLDGPT